MPLSISLVKAHVRHVIAAVFLFQLPLSVSAQNVEEDMRRLGIGGYLENLLETSPILKSAASQQQKATLLGLCEGFRSKKLDRLTVKVLRPTELHEFDLALAEFDGSAELIFLAFARREQGMEPFGYRFFSFPSQMSDLVKEYYPILPTIQPDATLIESATNAMTALCAKQDFAELDQFEVALAAQATSLPTWIKKRLDGKNKESAASDNAIFKTLKIGPTVQYVASKGITDDAFCSVFLIETSLAPGFMFITYWVKDGKPLVAQTGYCVGLEALAILPDVPKKSEEAR